MKLIGNYKEYITQSKLKIGKVYLFSEMVNESFVSACVYLGLNKKGACCFYVLMYLNVIVKSTEIYSLNEKELECLPNLVPLVMSNKSTRNNIKQYKSIQGKVLKDLGITVPNLNLWVTKQKIIDTNSLPELSDTNVREPRKYVKSKDLKVGDCYFNKNFIYIYVGKNNTKYRFRIIRYFHLMRGYNKNKTNRELVESIKAYSFLEDYDKLPCIYSIYENLDEINVTSSYLNKVLEQLRGISIV